MTPYKTTKLMVLTKYISIISVLTCAIYSWYPAHAATTSTIDTLLVNTNENLDIGILAIDANNQQVIYAKNEDREFMPASTLKLFTAAAALNYLGPDFQYDTTLYIDKVSNTIYLTFTGDPSFTSQNLFSLLSHLKEQGLTTIDSNIIIDANAFDSHTHAIGWTWDEINVHYAAPVSSVVIDENSFQFDLLAARQYGNNTSIKHADLIELHPVTNRSKTCDDKTLPLYLESKPFNHYNLSGCMAKKTRRLPFSISLNNTVYFAEQLIKKDLTKLGITLNGQIFAGTTNPQARVIAIHHSPALESLIQHMLKTSDSLYANILLKTLGQYYFQTVGSFENGALAEKAILDQAYHLDFSHTEIIDGGGLSRHNLLTPQLLVNLLYNVYHDDSIRDIFLSALPIAATDGTLKNRLEELKGRVLAKTGSLHGTSNLTGFIVDEDHTIAFAIMINNGLHRVKHYQSIEDQMLPIMFEN